MNKKKVLCLVCPTDNLEIPLKSRYGAETFFYTALGAYFDFDQSVQFRLWEIINELNIEEIIFVCSLNNVFYRNAFDEKGNRKFAVDQCLLKTRHVLSIEQIDSEMFSANFHLLATQYLSDQIDRLLATNYLGLRLEQSDIGVKALVHEPRESIFIQLKEVEARGKMLSSISYN